MLVFKITTHYHYRTKCIQDRGSFFSKHELNWDWLVGVCTDGASSLIGSKSGFKAYYALVKKPIMLWLKNAEND